MGATITISKENKYGTSHWVVTSEAHRLAIMLLNKKKTVDWNDITALKMLGFTVLDTKTNLPPVKPGGRKK